ncbi:MAG: hypothetical protein WCL53_00155 [Chloroflexota bacterium]
MTLERRVARLEDDARQRRGAGESEWMRAFTQALFLDDLRILADGLSDGAGNGRDLADLLATMTQQQIDHRRDWLMCRYAEHAAGNKVN